MKEISKYKDRFYNLLESEIGDVRPLVSEQSVIPNLELQGKIPAEPMRPLQYNPETGGYLLAQKDGPLKYDKSNIFSEHLKNIYVENGIPYIFYEDYNKQLKKIPIPFKKYKGGAPPMSVGGGNYDWIFEPKDLLRYLTKKQYDALKKDRYYGHDVIKTQKEIVDAYSLMSPLGHITFDITGRNVSMNRAETLRYVIESKPTDWELSPFLVSSWLKRLGGLMMSQTDSGRQMYYDNYISDIVAYYEISGDKLRKEIGTQIKEYFLNDKPPHPEDNFIKELQWLDYFTTYIKKDDTQVKNNVDLSKPNYGDTVGKSEPTSKIKRKLPNNKLPDTTDRFYYYLALEKQELFLQILKEVCDNRNYTPPKSIFIGGKEIQTSI